MKLTLVCFGKHTLWKVLAINVVSLGKVERACHQCQLQETAQQGGYACAEQAHLRQTAMSEDEKPVANEVEDVAGNHYPHRHGSVLHAIAELLVGIEQHLGQQAQQKNQQVRPHEGQELFRLPEPGKSCQDETCKKRQQQTYDRTGKESIPELACDVVQPTLSEQGANDRRQSV